MSFKLFISRIVGTHTSLACLILNAIHPSLSFESKCAMVAMWTFVFIVQIALLVRDARKELK